jgi:hypothetical protein
MMSMLGIGVLVLLSLTLIIGGLLNLGGCGDRIGEEYRLTNYLQIVLGGIMLAIILLL